jgi:hypothetical protein
VGRGAEQKVPIKGEEVSENSWNKTLARHYDVFKKPAPCDQCWHRQRCKDELLACDVFHAYVQRNQNWKKERNPTRKWWNKVFIEKDEDDEELESGT